MRTYQSRIAADSEQAILLAGYAERFSRVKRKLFADLCSINHGSDENTPASHFKKAYQKTYGLTARQFNAVSIELTGSIDAVKERRKGLVKELKTRIEKARKVLKKLIAKLASKEMAGDKTKRDKLKNSIHHKKRRLGQFIHRLEPMESDMKAGVVRICFGSKKLFHKQFALEENGYKSRDEWRNDWENARSAQFYVIGSKDETAGCQGCAAEYLGGNRFNLRLRLLDAMVEAGQPKYLTLPAEFEYGAEELHRSLRDGVAISYRFLRDDRGWRVFASTETVAAPLVSDKNLGVLGVDMNPDHLAVCEMDRFGNPIGAKSIPLSTYGLSTDQAAARIGNAVKRLIDMALDAHKPIVMEKLDFQKKKAELESESPKRSRMLSSFCYKRIFELIRARAKDRGIEILEVNPAYTSVIGKYKFSERYGMTEHQAAALAIGRRAFKLDEQPNRRMAAHVAFPLPERIRGKHVWSFWRQVARKAAAHAAQLRRASSSSSKPPARALGVIKKSYGRKMPAGSRHDSPQNRLADDMADLPF